MQSAPILISLDYWGMQSRRGAARTARCIGGNWLRLLHLSYVRSKNVAAAITRRTLSASAVGCADPIVRSLERAKTANWAYIDQVGFRGDEIQRATRHPGPHHSA